MNKTTIVLADDHRLFRLGLRQILEQIAAFVVIGEAANGLETVALVRDSQPDVVLMDISMPEMNGLEAVRRIREANLNCKLIVLSMHADRRYVLEALRAGASGYLLKDCAPEELRRAIQTVCEDHYYLSPALNGALVASLLQSAPPDESSPFHALSGREREVLQLIAEGSSTRDIADKLNLSVKTVESHRQHLMEKLKLHSVAELTRYAIREGLSPLD